MQDRFEKEVQRKMEELKLTPSAPVWEKIEMEIKVEKKRRRVFFWLFFAGLLLAGSTWWLSESSHEHSTQLHSQATENQTTNKIETGIKNPTVHPNTNDISKGLSKPSDNIPFQKENKKTNENSISVPVVAKSLPRSTEKIASTKKEVTKTSEPLITEKKASEKNNETINTPSITINESVTKSKKDVHLTQKPTDTKQIPVTNENKNTGLPSPQSFGSDSVTKESLKQEPMPTNLTTDSSSKKKIASNKKWTKQVNLMIGSSNFTSGLSLKSGGAQDAMFASIGSGTSGFVNNNYQPSEVSAGFGFSLGFSFSKKLNEHWETSVGLQYTHLSTKMKVGEKKNVDTGTRVSADGTKANEFFTNTSTTNYTNRFHILELPINISYRPSVNLPLYISAGISYGRLISTNALTFSSTTNVYYKNDQAYARNLLPAQLSVQYRLRDNDKVSLQAGPFIQYNFLEFQKQSADGRSHMLFAGLKTNVNF